MKKRNVFWKIITASLIFFSACNVNPENPTATVNHQSSSPIALNLSSPKNGEELDSCFLINGSASTEKGIKTVKIFYMPTNHSLTNNILFSYVGNTNSIIFSTNVNCPDSGYYYFYALAEDDLGNTAQTPLIKTFIKKTPDTTAPLSTITYPQNSQTLGKSFTAKGTATDSESGIEYVYLAIDTNTFYSVDVNGQNWAADVVFTNSGQHNISIFAVDNAGNVGITNTTYFTVESGMPNVNITSPASGIITNAASISLNGTASVETPATISKVSIQQNGSDLGNASGTISWSYQSDLTQGTNVFIATAFTSEGKSADSSPVRIILDSNKPVLSISAPANGTVIHANTTTITVNGTASDNESGLSGIYLSSGTGFSKISSSSTWSFDLSLTHGDYILSAYAADKAGNVSPTNSVTISIVPVTNAGLTVHFKKPASWSHATIYYWKTTPDNMGTNWPGVPMYDDGNGWYKYTFSNQSAANIIFSDNGNSQTADLSRDKEGWYMNNQWYDQNPEDSIPPTVSLTSPSDGASLNGIITLNADASDNIGVTKVEYYYNGSNLIASSANAPYTVNWDTRYIPNGNHTLTARAYDAVNSSDSAIITVSTSNPNLPPVANAGDDIYAAVGQTVHFNAGNSYDTNGSIVSYTWDNGMTGASPTYVYNNTGDYNVTLTVTDNEGASDSDTVTVHVSTNNVEHRDFREETVYFIMTDRFADGDPNNNNIWGDEYTSDIYNIHDTSKTGVLSYYHGGDFKGIIDNLDYIQDMGFTAIWITPVVKQPEGRHIYDPNDPITGHGGDYYSASAYHGYWGYDFDEIDPHLHSSGTNSDGWADFDALVQALHSRGMKLMLDIVVNHGHPQNVAQSSKTFGTRNTVIMDGRSWTWETDDPYWNPNQDPHTDGFFSYANGTWLMDLIDFNEHGTNNAVKHLENVYKRFIDHGVDAFRIDTVAYMSADFWQKFTACMKEHAASIGKKNFYMCGEAWTGDRTAAVGLIYNDGKNTNFNMLDLHGSSMDFPGWMGNAFKGDRGFDDPNGWLRISGKDGDQSGKYDPTYLATFVDNHDVTRANGILNETQYMNDLNYIYLFRGIPIVYYGTEILYSSWPYYITTTDKNDVVARWMLGASGIAYVKNNHPTLYKHIKMLNALRHSSPALQKGQQHDLYVYQDDIVFNRDYGANQAYVAMSKGNGFTYTVNGMKNGTYRLITPDTANATYHSENVNISNGSYTFTVPDNSFVMLDK